MLNWRLFLLGNYALAASLTTLNLSIDLAQAQRPSLGDCNLFSSPDGICFQGQGSSFAWQAILQLLRRDESNVFPTNGIPGMLVNPGPTSELFPQRFNYGSRGAGAALDGYTDLLCLDTEAAVAGAFDDVEAREFEAISPLIELSGQECSFFISEAPLNTGDIAEYYIESSNPSFAALPNFIDSAYELGLGRAVQLPLFGGLVTISYNIPGLASGTSLTTAQYCQLFNEHPISGVPGFGGTTGVVRSDGSGTTAAFSRALEARCSSIGLWTTLFGTGRGSGEDGLREGDSTQVGAGASKGSVVRVGSTPLCQVPVAARAGANAVIVDTGETEPADNFVCWPDSVLGAVGDDGVSLEISAAPNRYGYVDLAEANVAALDRAVVENPETGLFYEATVDNGVSAFSAIAPLIAGFTETPVDSNVTDDFCVIEFDTAHPPDGYPFVAFSYGLFYGDYLPLTRPVNAFVFPDANPPTAGNPNPGNVGSPIATRYGFNGPALASGYETLVTTLVVGPFSTPAKAHLINAGYVPVFPDLGLAVFQRALQCINVVAAGNEGHRAIG